MSIIVSWKIRHRQETLVSATLIDTATNPLFCGGNMGEVTLCIQYEISWRY